MKIRDQSLLSTQVSQNCVCSSGLSRLVWQQVTITFLLTSQSLIDLHYKYLPKG